MVLAISIVTVRLLRVWLCQGCGDQRPVVAIACDGTFFTMGRHHDVVVVCMLDLAAPFP
jgi:hypothetical protein